MWIKTLKNYRTIACSAFAKQQNYVSRFQCQVWEKIRSNFLYSDLFSFISAFSRTSFPFSELFQATFWHMLPFPSCDQFKSQPWALPQKGKSAGGSSLGEVNKKDRLSAMLQNTLKTSAVFGTILSQSRANFSTTQKSKYVTLSSYCATLTKIPSLRLNIFFGLRSPQNIPASLELLHGDPIQHVHSLFTS